MPCTYWANYITKYFVCGLDSIFKLYNPTDTSLFPYVINASTVWERFGLALLFIIVMICFIGVLCIATYFILFIYTVDLMDVLQLKIS